MPHIITGLKSPTTLTPLILQPLLKPNQFQLATLLDARLILMPSIPCQRSHRIQSSFIQLISLSIRILSTARITSGIPRPSSAPGTFQRTTPRLLRRNQILLATPLAAKLILMPSIPCQKAHWIHQSFIQLISLSILTLSTARII
jgi:hypothetical protein